MIDASNRCHVCLPVLHADDDDDRLSFLSFSVAGSTVARQCSRKAAFFHALTLSHVWLGLPGGRFQSDGGLRIVAATAR